MRVFQVSVFQGSNCTNCSDIHEHLESLHTTKRAIIPKLLTIVHLILINPATFCTSERSFSVARRIKAWLRSMMTTKRFNNLFCQFIELTDSISLVDIGNEFGNMISVERTWVNLSPVICYDFLKLWLSIYCESKLVILHC